MDMAILGGTVISFSEENEGVGIIEDGVVGIIDDKIEYVGTEEELVNDAEKVVDASGCVIMPGLVNAHAHTRWTLLRGGAQDVPEIEWMNKALGPLARHMEKEDEIVGSKLGVIEGIKSGTTTFCEFAENVSDLVENVYKELGARVVAAETINEVTETEKEELGPRDLYPLERDDEGISRSERLFDKYQNDDGVTPMYGPQALDMVTEETLKEIRDRARNNGRRVHMHVAQGERERLQIDERYGKTTVSVLEEKNFLDGFLTAAHLHGASKKERKRMIRREVKMVGCPSSIASIDGITPPLAEYTSSEGVSGIGTDQAPGPGHHNMFKEMRTTSMLSKTDEMDPTTMPSWKVLEIATIGGAKALGIGNEVGSLEEGKKADITVVDLDALNLSPVVESPFRNVIPNLVYSSMGNEVRDVILGGDFVVEDGELVTGDENEIVREANSRAKKVFDSASEDWRNADSKLVEKVGEGWL